MPIYLASAIPNAWLPSQADQKMVISSLSVKEAMKEIFDRNLVLKSNVISCVSHESMSNKMAEEFLNYGNLKICVPLSKREIHPQKGDVIIAMINVISYSNRCKSRVVTKEELINQRQTIPTKWVKCVFE